ncbi:MAG: HAD hydrolase-like protein [Bacteroidales bacterium]|jgi:phosphoglycolate phosphatase
MRSKKTLIWDWNGTLLDDAEICVYCINALLRKRNLKEITLQKYREVFTFPVVDYYREVGFDFEKEPFEIPAMEFIDLYHQLLPKAPLFNNVEQTLSGFSDYKINQVILSAMEQNSLINTLKSNRIHHLFDQVFGIADHYAQGKLQRGMELINRLNQPLDEIILIGDTLHDKEVAGHLGVEVVLIANGHQSKERLLKSGARVLDSIGQLQEVLLN